jgi:hypothetical protein
MNRLGREGRAEPGVRPKVTNVFLHYHNERRENSQVKVRGSRLGFNSNNNNRAYIRGVCRGFNVNVAHVPPHRSSWRRKTKAEHDNFKRV